MNLKNLPAFLLGFALGLLVGSGQWLVLVLGGAAIALWGWLREDRPLPSVRGRWR